MDEQILSATTDEQYTQQMIDALVDVFHFQPDDAQFLINKFGISVENGKVKQTEQGKEALLQLKETLAQETILTPKQLKSISKKNRKINKRKASIATTMQ